MDKIKLVVELPQDWENRIVNLSDSEAVDFLYGILRNGVLFQEICDKENSEIKNKIKDLSKRVETLEKQMKEDKEEQLKKLEAKLDYAKFRCALPTIMDMMRS